MSKTLLRRVGLGLLATLALALLGLNALAWSGGLVDEETAVPEQKAPAETTPPPGESSLTRPATRPKAQAISRERTLARAKPKPSRTTLILAATRGDCWVEVRAGSATGEALYAGTLSSGSSLRFNRPKLWLRLGAASNVDIVVNGRPSSVPPGTVELVLPDA
jgi:hypothetical protein